MKCGNEWGESVWKPFLEESDRARAKEYAEAEAAAEARGIMTATANENGYVKCPHCGWRFSIRYPMSWDGKMHLSCHTRLQITNGEQFGAGNDG